MRRVMRSPGVKVGTICHGMWLLCADRALLEGKRVTCAHNIACDVENAGADVVYDGDATSELVIDGDLISGKHPGMVARFMDTFRSEIEATATRAGPLEHARRTA
jgi:protease I